MDQFVARRHCTPAIAKTCCAAYVRLGSFATFRTEADHFRSSRNSRLLSRPACLKGAKCGHWRPSTHEMPNDTIQWHGFAICVTDNQFWATREERLFSSQARSGNQQCERLQISISITLTLTLGIFPTCDSGIRSCGDV